MIIDILQEAWPDDHITEAMVLSPGEAILFFGRHYKNEVLPYHKATDVDLGFRRPIQQGQEVSADRSFEENCAGRSLCHPQGCGREEDEDQRARATTWEDKASQNSSCSL